MAITVKHSKVSTIPDDADTSLVRPSDWNADHTLTGTVPVANGGTGASTASDGLNNLLPSQTGNNGKVLATDGTNASWTTNGSGDVVGPASATDNAIARFDSTTGKLIQNSGVTVDDNSNITTNAIFEGFSNTAASGTQIVLTAASVPSYVITGSGGQTIKLPDATTLPNGTIFSFNNNQSSGAITVNNNSNTLIVSIPSGAFTIVTLLSNSIAAGSWDTHDQAPANVSWSTNTFSYAGSFTNGTWNGNAVAYNRGGTGQSAAFVAGGIVYGSTTTALAVTAIGTTGQVLTSAGAGTPTWTTPTTGTVTGVTATSPVVSSGGSAPVISMPAATGSVDGYLTSADWTTFNGKGSGTVTSVSGTASNISSTGGTTPVIDLVSTAVTPATYTLATITVDAKGRITSASNGTAGAGTVTSITAGTGLSGGTITSTGTIAIDSTVATLTGTQTLTNKRVTNRTGSNGATTSGNITPTGDTADQYNITGLTGSAAIQIPSGTPTDAQRLSIRIKDNGTARALTWVTSAGGYRVIGTTLPTTTTASKTIYVGCVYNSADSFWDVVAVASEV